MTGGSEEQPSSVQPSDAGGALPAVVEAASDLVAVLDPLGRVTFLNAAGLALLGAGDPASILGRPLADFLVPEAGVALRDQHLPAARSNGRWIGETCLRCGDGGPVPASQVITCHRDAAGEPAFFSTIVRDIRAYKEIEQELRESRRLLEWAQEVGQMGSWWSDPHEAGRLRWSQQTYRVFGVPEDRFDGRVETFFSLVHPEDREAVKEASRAALEGRAPYRIEHRVLRPDGRVVWVHERAEVIRDEQGRPLRMIGVCQDITERRELEEQLFQARKVESIGRLAGGVAHDFNNLLTVILGAVDLLQDQLAGDEPALGLVRCIHDAARRASHLTGQLLAYARRQVVVPRVLDTNALLLRVQGMLRRTLGPGVELELACAEGVWPVRIDPGQCEQLLVNLALNAREAMPGGGRVRITTMNIVVDEVRAQTMPPLKPGEHVLLTLHDTGRGMDDAVLRHAFEPFYTTKPVGQGTGMGLASCLGIVQQSGGHIALESAAGHGCTVHVYLPRCTDDLAAPPQGAIPADRRGSETLLLVDDEPALRAMAAEALRRLGYTVLEAASGAEALHLCRAGTPIDLVVTDVVMPGMTGPQLFEALRKEQIRTRVLFTSAYHDLTSRSSPLLESAPFLLKPFTPGGLALKVREVLSIPSGEH